MNNQLAQKTQYYLNESNRLNEELKLEQDYTELLENILLELVENNTLTEEQLEEALRSRINPETGNHEPGLIRRVGRYIGILPRISKKNIEKQKEVDNTNLEKLGIKMGDKTAHWMNPSWSKDMSGMGASDREREYFVQRAKLQDLDPEAANKLDDEVANEPHLQRASGIWNSEEEKDSANPSLIQRARGAIDRLFGKKK